MVGQVQFIFEEEPSIINNHASTYNPLFRVRLASKILNGKEGRVAPRLKDLWILFMALPNLYQFILSVFKLLHF